MTDHPYGLGLLQAVEYVDLMSKTRSFNFVHFSVQEFLAARYTLTNGQQPSFKHFLQGRNHEIAVDDKFFQNLYLYRIFYEAGNHQICKIIEEKYTNKKN